MVRQKMTDVIDGKNMVFRGGNWVQVRDTRMPQAIKDSPMFHYPRVIVVSK